MKQRKLLNVANDGKCWKHNYWHNEALKFAKHIYSSNSIYTFIPKNASQTMRYSIDIENGIWDVDCQKQWTTKVSSNNVFSPTLQYQIRNNYAFVILRCPFSRLASAFLDQFIRRPHIYITHQHKEGILKRTLDPTFRNYVTFERFVKKIQSNWRFFTGNAHWSPQVQFLLYENYDDYFCIEEFSHVIKTLKEKINLKVYDARKISKHGIDGLKKISIPNSHKLNMKDIMAMKEIGEIIDPKSLFNEELYDITKNLYRNDINLYKNKVGEKNLMF